MVSDDERVRCQMGCITRSRFMVSIALSIPLTTLIIFPVTWRIVTAVSTLEATASIRLERRSRLRASLFFRIAFEAYIRAPSLFPCCNAYRECMWIQTHWYLKGLACLLQFVLLCVLIFLSLLCLSIEWLCRELRKSIKKVWRELHSNL
jgi:uncharacterized protein involved in cysteine biosynthesis